MLERLFIKDYKNTKDDSVRCSYGKLGGLFGIISNLFLGVIKVLVGLASNSVSIMADAINNLFDMASSILTIIGFSLTNKKADKTHPYGHARYEYIFGVIIAIIMILVASLFARESIIKIIRPVELNISLITIGVLLVSILIKLIQMNIYLRFSKKINSQTLKTSALDTRNDCLTTFVILVSMIVMKLCNINIDGYLGLATSVFIIYSAFNALREVMDPLIGIKPDNKQINKIKNKLLSYDFVLGIHDLVIHSYGENKDFVTVDVELDSSLSLLKAHDLIDKIENDFEHDMDLDISIHVDPVIVGDKKVENLKKKITKELLNINKKITIHDFRVIEKRYKVKVLFDVVLPFGVDLTYQEIKEYLYSNIKHKKEIEYYIEIHRPFS